MGESLPTRTRETLYENEFGSTESQNGIERVAFR